MADSAEQGLRAAESPAVPAAAVPSGSDTADEAGAGEAALAAASTAPQTEPAAGASSGGGKKGERPKLPRPEGKQPCPRCASEDTKWCYYNNYNIKQPRYYCRGCQRYWTAGGALRDVPPGAGRRKNKSGTGSAPKPAAKRDVTAVAAGPLLAASMPLVLPQLALPPPFVDPALAAYGINPLGFAVPVPPPVLDQQRPAALAGAVPSRATSAPDGRAGSGDDGARPQAKRPRVEGEAAQAAAAAAGSPSATGADPPAQPPQQQQRQQQQEGAGVQQGGDGPATAAGVGAGLGAAGPLPAEWLSMAANPQQAAQLQAAAVGLSQAPYAGLWPPYAGAGYPDVGFWPRLPPVPLPPGVQQPAYHPAPGVDGASLLAAVAGSQAPGLPPGLQPHSAWLPQPPVGAGGLGAWGGPPPAGMWVGGLPHLPPAADAHGWTALHLPATGPLATQQQT